MTGRWTKEDQEYWDKPENRLLFEFNCLFTSKNYWERNPDNSKKMDEDLRKLFKNFLALEANRVQPEVINFLGDKDKVYICKLKILGFPFATFDKDKADAWVAEDAESKYYDIVEIRK